MRRIENQISFDDNDNIHTFDDEISEEFQEEHSIRQNNFKSIDSIFEDDPSNHNNNDEDADGDALPNVQGDISHHPFLQQLSQLWEQISVSMTKSVRPKNNGLMNQYKPVEPNRIQKKKKNLAKKFGNFQFFKVTCRSMLSVPESIQINIKIQVSNKMREENFQGFSVLQ